MKTKDDGIQAVRDIRTKISSECDNDPEKLVNHYIELQKQHSNQLIKPVELQPCESNNQLK